MQLVVEDLDVEGAGAVVHHVDDAVGAGRLPRQPRITSRRSPPPDAVAKMLEKG